MSWVSIAKVESNKQTPQVSVQHNIVPKPISKKDDGIPRHREITPGPADDMWLSNGEIQQNIDISDDAKSQDINYGSVNGNRVDQKTPTPKIVSDEFIQQTIKLISDHKNNDDIKYNAPESSNYAVNYEHVNFPIQELSDKIELDEKEHCATNLLDLFDKIEVTDDHLAMWQLWCGKFANKADAKKKLETLINYAEQKPSSPRIKTQLRIITKLIVEKDIKESEEFVHILLLLASHGSVCNVMKDIAINNGYGMMTGNLVSIIQLQTLSQQILKELRNYRHILVEELHLKFKFHTNQHTVNGFYNEMAQHVGLIKYVDEHLGTPSWGNYKTGVKERFFATLYTKENIIKRIYRLIDEKKISYQKIVQFMQDNCPHGIDKMDFLQQAINIDDGKINENYLCWLLEKLNVLLIKTKDWKDIEKCWEDIK